jgi:hypothetical protein
MAENNGGDMIWYIGYDGDDNLKIENLSTMMSINYK